MLNLRQRSEADGFVTTEKDAVNLGGYLAALEPLAVVPVKMELADAANAVDTMLARIAERRRFSHEKISGRAAPLVAPASCRLSRGRLALGGSKLGSNARTR